jgi:hypothetical protein
MLRTWDYALLRWKIGLMESMTAQMLAGRAESLQEHTVKEKYRERLPRNSTTAKSVIFTLRSEKKNIRIFSSRQRL